VRLLTLTLQPPCRCNPPYTQSVPRGGDEGERDAVAADVPPVTPGGDLLDLARRITHGDDPFGSPAGAGGLQSTPSSMAPLAPPVRTTAAPTVAPRDGLTDGVGFVFF